MLNDFGRRAAFLSLPCANGSSDLELFFNCQKRRDRRTGIQIAAAFWEHDLIQMLLGLGSDPSICSPDGYTALHWLLDPEELIYEDKSEPISNRRLRELRKGQPRYQKSWIAASVRSLARSPLARISSIYSPCSNGKTPFKLTARNSPTATKILLEEGTETDKQDSRGRTALMHFFLDGFNGRSPSILRDLLHARADSRVAHSSGRTVLGYWAYCVTNEELADIYVDFNSYNEAFHISASLGALSRRECLVQELACLNVPLVVASRLRSAALLGLG
ncbi:hypothetical protein LX36DRAFT_324121 [Colletotrichum falcatum]|nr:hypothetical protein LX36DRAFT_324121 [Colletotrichum falcatum]